MTNPVGPHYVWSNLPRRGSVQFIGDWPEAAGVDVEGVGKASLFTGSPAFDLGDTVNAFGRLLARYVRARAGWAIRRG